MLGHKTHMDVTDISYSLDIHERTYINKTLQWRLNIQRTLFHTMHFIIFIFVLYFFDQFNIAGIDLRGILNSSYNFIVRLLKNKMTGW